MKPVKKNTIRIIPRAALDPEKWDHCIDQSPNSLLYGRFHYLENMTGGQWDALVKDDYEAIMPLTRRKKWGIAYLAQPPFTQQSGIFSPAPISNALITDFLNALKDHYRFAEINLNFANPHPSLTPATNLILPLHSTYEQLAAAYKTDLHKNLRIAARSRLTYSHTPGLRMMLSLYRELYGRRTPHVKDPDYERFEKICKHLQENNKIMLRGVTNDAGEWMATALLLQDKDRFSLLQSCIVPAARNTAANHFLLDGVIRELAGRPLILDFEGSDMAGIAHFYRNFGATDQPYFTLRHNALPWPIKRSRPPRDPQAS